MIVTVTLNPAVDEEFVVSDFRPGGWFRSRNANRSPGGKGINVSLLLSQLGYETAAMGFLAGFNGGYIRDVLRKARITTNFVHVKGETRTNVYIVDETGKMETGLSEPGPYVPDEAYERFMKNYERMLKRARLVLLGGSLPPGVPQDAYASLIERAKNIDVPVWIDAAGAPLMSGLDAVPNLAKIDHRFMSKVSGISLTSLDNLIEVLTRLHDHGIEWSITSYHTYGDVFFTTSSEIPEETGLSSVLLDNIQSECYLNSFCFGYRLHNFKSLSPHFLRFFLRGEQFRRSIIRLAQGSTRFNISKKFILNLFVFVPSITEQTAIANVLSTADKEIDLLKQKLDTLKQQKKALMQLLLTGIVRTTGLKTNYGTSKEGRIL